MAPPAPTLRISRWLNSTTDITLEALRGKVVLLHFFQMLCPGCVMHGVPQTQRLAESLERDDLAILGIHSVFEHHESMQPVALETFAYEFRLRFPIGIDLHQSGDPLPVTMRAYELRGTPTTVLIDRAGQVRVHKFGAMSDLELGLSLGSLLAERSS